MPRGKQDASLTDAVTGAMEMGMKLGEIAIASSVVVGARMMLIGAAMRNPLSGDYRELGRMVPEKVSALAQSGMALMEQVTSAQRDMLAHMTDSNNLISGGLQTPATLMKIATEAGARSSRAMMWPFAASDATLAPVYRTVTANARRLQTRRSR